MRIGVVCVIKEAWGGSEELWAAMAHEAIAAGHEVIVSAYNCGEVHPKMQALIDKGLKLIYRRGYVKPGLPLFKRVLSKATVILQNKLQNPFDSFFKARPDVVLYNGTSYTCVEDKALFLSLIKNRISYYYLSHIAADYYRPIGLNDLPIARIAFTHAKKNFFIAKKAIKITERQLGIYLPNTLIVRNPVFLDNLQPLSFPSVDSTIQFAMVGILVVAHKGQDMALEALSDPVWKNRDWHLNIYGSGVDEEFIKTLVSHYGLEDRVTLHGKVDNIRSVWEKNHILLMSSLMEGMPLAVVEAMLCCRPCLVTDVGDHTEWINDNTEGYVAEAPSVTSLKKTLERTWQNIGNWEHVGKNARLKALSIYQPDPGKRLLELLH